MCEILVKAIDHAHIDPYKDKAGCYKRGDPVVVMPDGHEWGRKECLPKFYVVKVPGLSVEVAKKYIQVEEDGGRPITRRLYRLNIDGLKLGDKEVLEATGRVTLSTSTIQGKLKKK